MVAVEAKATKRPSVVIDDSPLAPSAAVVPSGVEIKFVKVAQPPTPVTQVPRSNTSGAPFGLTAVWPRFVALDVKETKKRIVCD